MGQSKKVKAYDKYLGKLIKKKRLVEVFRLFHKNTANLYGYILKKSEDFIVLQNEEDFRLDGFSIFRKDQFEFISHDDKHSMLEEIMLKEGIIDKNLGMKTKVKLDSWSTIFKSLQKANKHVIVECEAKSDQEFYIGAIVKVSKNSVHIHHYDGSGIMDESPTKIKFEDVTLLRYDARYIKIFKKYAGR